MTQLVDTRIYPFFEKQHILFEFDIIIIPQVLVFNRTWCYFQTVWIFIQPSLENITPVFTLHQTKSLEIFDWHDITFKSL